MSDVVKLREALQAAVDALTHYAGCFRAMGAIATASDAERDTAQILATLTGPVPE